MFESKFTKREIVWTYRELIRKRQKGTGIGLDQAFKEFESKYGPYYMKTLKEKTGWDTPFQVCDKAALQIMAGLAREVSYVG